MVVMSHERAHAIGVQKTVKGITCTDVIRSIATVRMVFKNSLNS
jgi:hypothetical protein